MFALPFLGIGMWLLISALGMWRTYLRSESWVSVPATIEEVQFQTHRGTGSRGGSSTSYSVTCRYAYAVGNRVYRCDRVGVEGGKGSSDGYHRRRFDALERHRSTGATFAARVNPANPREALLFRERTTTMYVLPLVGLLFGSGGLGMAAAGWRSVLSAAGMRRRRERDPGRPWRADPRWQGFSVEAHPLRHALGMLAGSLFTGIFVTVFVVAMRSDPHAPTVVKVIVAVLGLIPVGLLAASVYAAARYAKYGNPRLVFTRLPLVIGSENTALLHVRAHVAARDGIEVALRCVRREWVRHGNKRSVHESEVYCDKSVVREDMAAGTRRGTAIPVRFRIPAGAAETQTSEWPQHVWRISAKAATPGVNFGAEFEVPVFRVSDPALAEENPLLRG